MKYIITRTPPDELRHFGTKGQKWGHRHYQNEDGTWTSEGQKRYSTDTDGQYGEPGGERSTPAQGRARKNKKAARKERRSKRGKQVVEKHANKPAKSSGSEKALSTGFKALNAYLAYRSFKDEWE